MDKIKADKNGVRAFGPCNKLAELDYMGQPAPEAVVGLPTSRVLTNDYCKSGDKDSAGELIEEMISGGPPYFNISKPKPVF